MPFMMEDFYKGQQLAFESQQRKDEAAAQKQIQSTIADIFKPEGDTTPAAGSAPTGYQTGTGFDGRQTTMPKGAMSMSPNGSPMPSFMGEGQAPVSVVDQAATPQKEEAPKDNPTATYMKSIDNIKNYDREESQLNKMKTLGRSLQGSPNINVAKQGMKYVTEADTELNRIREAKKSNIENAQKYHEQISGVFLNINDQQSLDVANAQLQAMGRDLQNSIQVPRQNPDGTPLLDQTGKPVMDTISTKVFTPELKRYTQSIGMGLLDANKQMTIRNQMSEIENRGAGGGKADAGTNRVIQSMTQASDALTNLSNLPFYTTDPVYGNKMFNNLFTAPLGSLNQQMSTESSQLMADRMAGVARNLASLETGGAATGLVGLADKIDQGISIKAGSKPIVALDKMAEMRRIVESSAKATLATNIKPEKRALIEANLEEVRKAIPFTQKDVDNLRVKLGTGNKLAIGKDQSNMSFTEYMTKLKEGTTKPLSDKDIAKASKERKSEEKKTEAAPSKTSAPVFDADMLNQLKNM